ncbi:MAG: arginine--tRNA ligase [Bacteroidota bacterium]
MSLLSSHIQTSAAEVVKDLFEVEITPETLPVQDTRKDFEGDLTIVVFPLTKFKLGAPPQIAEKLGSALVERLESVTAYNVVKGFLNLSIGDAYWQSFVAEQQNDPDFFATNLGEGQTVVVEYCSPNTNKPLHLGHLRNIVLGYSLTQILQANGFNAIPTCLFNDRGTNISKSMHAYLSSENKETPDSSSRKGDKIVGDYYVKFAGMIEEESKLIMATEGISKDEAAKKAPSQLAINEMTIRWEEGDAEIRALWEQMNAWVYAAYEDTFQRLGISFDRYFYESEVYKRGKETVQEGLEKGAFYHTEDGSVEVDLTAEGMDRKTLLRSNGTSLYITQDLAIAEDKYNEYKMDRSIYVVGNEQDYHFQVLFKVLAKLEKPYAQGLYHMSYGMVDLPSGKMKSREGTTVEIDDLLTELESKAREETLKNLDKLQDMEEAELNALFQKLGTGAVKYFLAKVDPKKRMMFDPKESVSLKGNTGPYIQYAYARIQSIRRNADHIGPYSADLNLEEPLLEAERTLIQVISRYKDVLREAGENYNPALLANYAYELTKEFNRFYRDAPILKSSNPHTSSFRLALASFAGETLKNCMALLGIQMPERM